MGSTQVLDLLRFDKFPKFVKSHSYLEEYGRDHLNPSLQRNDSGPVFGIESWADIAADDPHVTVQRWDEGAAKLGTDYPGCTTLYGDGRWF